MDRIAFGTLEKPLTKMSQNPTRTIENLQVAH